MLLSSASRAGEGIYLAEQHAKWLRVQDQFKSGGQAAACCALSVHARIKQLLAVLAQRL
jgi:hypothetical protein